MPLPEAHRFIPTRMGNTRLPSLLQGHFAVHPHTHGEHTVFPPGNPGLIGSSPHAWGTRAGDNHLPVNLRFIPTRMGNTCLSLRISSIWSVHPHTHGEHYRAGMDFNCLRGSSPHAWGTRVVAVDRRGRGRFIPTRMGNTRRRRSPRAARPVHPHTHGEHYCLIRSPCFANGSSPHAWGTRISRSCICRYRRFIPTRMGNTVRFGSIQ